MPSGSTVTIVIPTYNRAVWLRESVDAALAQTREPDVVLVADNGSDDETRETMELYRDEPRVSYVRRPSNIAPISNFNGALARVTTDYVALVCDDDRVYPDFVRETAGVLDSYERVAVAHTRVDFVDEGGAVIRPDLNLVGRPGNPFVEPGADFIRECMTSRWRVGMALARTSVLRDVGFFPGEPVDPLMSDLVMWMEVALDWDIAHIEQTLGAYRHHPNALTSHVHTYTDMAFIHSPKSADAYLSARLDFLARHRERLDEVDRLRFIAQRAWRLDRINDTDMAAYPERPRDFVSSELWSTLRRDPRTALELSAWRLLCASLAGQRASTLAHRGKDHWNAVRRGRRSSVAHPR